MTADRASGPRLLKPAEVASLFGVDVKTVGRWARRRLVPSIRTPGGHRRYPEAAIRALVAGQKPASRDLHQNGEGPRAAATAGAQNTDRSTELEEQ